MDSCRFSRPEERVFAVEVAWITERKDRGSKVREERRYGAARVGEVSIGIPFLRRILSLV